jgi:hypothetical protein
MGVCRDDGDTAWMSRETDSSLPRLADRAGPRSPESRREAEDDQGEAASRLGLPGGGRRSGLNWSIRQRDKTNSQHEKLSVPRVRREASAPPSPALRAPSPRWARGKKRTKPALFRPPSPQRGEGSGVREPRLAVSKSTVHTVYEWSSVIEQRDDDARDHSGSAICALDTENGQA